jgi:predicted nucleic acid-binding protein
VYLDTSVIGGCFDVEFSKWSSALFTDFRDGIYIPVISDLVEAEIQDAPEKIKSKLIELFEMDCEILRTDDDSIDLANQYQERGILSPKFFNDGLHIAIATVHILDILVSWNFKHIVHFNRIHFFNAVNIAMGYKPIEIYSPREVTTYEQD